MRALSLVSLSLLIGLAWPSQSEILKGTPALQGYAAQTEGFLRVTSIGGDPLDKQLDVWMTLPHSSTALSHYQV
jgi:hypothetical protein